MLPVVFVALVVMSWVVYSQTARPPRPLQTERVKDNLYMISGEGGNVAMRVTTEGVVLVDDMFYRNHDAILAQMKSITNQPLRYVINTHQHDDHAGGDAIISFPDLKVIHTGDLFLASGAARAGTRTFSPGSNLFVDSSQGGSLMEWTKTLDGALSLDVDAVIPGHGPVATKADVQAFRNGVAAMQARLRDLVRGGISREDLAKTIEMEYGWRSTGCPLTPPTPGCLQYQQLDALMAELRNVR